jgi:hypothetical protein
MNKYVAPRWTFEEIRLKWERAKTLDFKSRLKEIKTLVHAIDNTSDSLTLESALLYMDILKAAQPFDEWGNAKKALAKLMPKYLKAIGCEAVEVITEIQYAQHGEGQIVIGDPMIAGREVKWYKIDPTDILSMINSGKIFSFESEDLIVIDSCLRLIKAPEPVMLAQEYKQLKSSTPIVIIKIESSSVALLDEGGEGIKAEMSLTPGNYKICAYQLGKRNSEKDHYVIVMCATDRDAANDLKSLPNLCGG